MNSRKTPCIELSEDELLPWLKNVVALAPAPATLLLEGAIGAGKTTLTRLLGEALGVRGRVTSPSFVTLQEYTTALGVPLLHLDLYRLEATAADSLLLEVDDLLAQAPAWVMIEWASLFQEMLPPSDATITIEPVVHSTHSARRYTVQPRSPMAQAWIEALHSQHLLDEGEASI